jgi:hypothetical protein
MIKSSPARLAMRTKLFITALAVSGTAAVAGQGTFGTFTSATAAQTQTDASGTVTLDFGAAATTNRLAVGATNLAAGDTLQRGFTLRNGGSLADAGTTMQISDASPTLLDSVAGAANGLTIQVDRCSAGFVESGSTPYTYTCASGRSTVLAATPVSTVEANGVSGTSLPGLSALSPSGTDSLIAILTLPSAAGNSHQGLSSTLAVGFTATQRAATNQ